MSDLSNEELEKVTDNLIPNLNLVLGYPPSHPVFEVKSDFIDSILDKHGVSMDEMSKYHAVLQDLHKHLWVGAAALAPIVQESKPDTESYLVQMSTGFGGNYTVVADLLETDSVGGYSMEFGFDFIADKDPVHEFVSNQFLKRREIISRQSRKAKPNLSIVR